MPSGSTMGSRCKRALSYLNEYQTSDNRYWVLLAQDSPWQDENEPPIFHSNLRSIPELIGFVYVSEVNVVFEDSAGSVILPTTAFQPVTDLDLTSLSIAKAHHVHFEASVSQEVLSQYCSSYRTIGLCTDIEFEGAFSPEFIPGELVLPADVRRYFVDWISTVRAVQVADQDNHTFRIVRSF